MLLNENGTYVLRIVAKCPNISEVNFFFFLTDYFAFEKNKECVNWYCLIKRYLYNVPIPDDQVNLLCVHCK